MFRISWGIAAPPISGSPAVSGGVVVVGAEDGRVYAFGAGKGSPE